jgi:exo-beta-1,3-glucanase (GH17 family)
MMNKRKIERAVVSLISVLILFTLSCDRESAKVDQDKVELEMTTLKTNLESRAPQQREEPFRVRAFEPFLGDKWVGNAVAYGCYRKGQAPGVQGPSDVELLEDLNIMAKHWNMIRLYGSDSDTRRVIELIDTHNLPLKVVLGVWLAPEVDEPHPRPGNIKQVMLAIDLSRKYPDVIAAISVGNETQVFWSAHKMNLDNLIRYIRAVRKNTSVPVTTADDYLYWNKPESKSIADETDFVFTHIHPLWNGQTLDDAMRWTDKIYHELQAIHPNRIIVIGETGWATDYNADKKGPGEQGTLVKGEVSYDAQASFLIQLKKWVESNQVPTFLFEAFDESWKGGGEDSPANEIEKHWGVYNEDRTPKPSFLKFLESQPPSPD